MHLISVAGAASASSTEVVSRAVEVLRAGDVVALPTETVYGIAALPAVSGATARLFDLKGRGAHVPLAVLCSDADQALGLADEPGDEVTELARSAWPGPLTLVLKRRAGLGYELGEPTTTIGVRCPDHDLVRAICSGAGPVATTSANPHGEPTPTTASAVAGLFGDELALVLDGGECTGEPSTVVDATGGGPRSTWRILRQGSYRL